jgi:hypothetical protein
MPTIRRWYLFLICVVSLQAATWALISLLRNLLVPALYAISEVFALQIAVVVVGLPIYLGHWFWAQRLANADSDERESPLRRFYLYGTLALFLSPFVVNAYDLLSTVASMLLGQPQPQYMYSTLSNTQMIVIDLAAMVVLAPLWFYHHRIVASDARAVPEQGLAALVRRWYFLGFAGMGTAMTISGIIDLLRQLMGLDALIFRSASASLLVGLALWLWFWPQAQRLFTAPNPAERASVLRKFYLYLAVFIGVVGVVTNLALILAGFFRRLLTLPPSGNIREPLAMAVGLGLVWAYHTLVLRHDASLAEEGPHQASLRRLYLYLLAGIGLFAFLMGLALDSGVLIQLLASEPFRAALREQLALSSAGLLIGLAVWFFPWRQAQAEALAHTTVGAESRRSIIRKLYLYLFLFGATLTILGSAIYFVYQLLSFVLGARSAAHLLSDLAYPIAYGLIAAGVWLYHIVALRGDAATTHQHEAERLAAVPVALLDVGEGRFGRALLGELHRTLPDLTISPIGLTEAAAQALGTPHGARAALAQLANAGLIVGPWQIAVAGAAGGAVTPEIAQAVATSPAPKVLVPTHEPTWEWAGVDRWDDEALVNQTAYAIKQMLSGEAVTAKHPLGPSAIVAIIIALFILLGVPFIFALSRMAY